MAVLRTQMSDKDGGIEGEFDLLLTPAVHVEITSRSVRLTREEKAPGTL